MSKTMAKWPTRKIHEPQMAMVGKRGTTTSSLHEAKFERTVYGKDKGNNFRG